MNTNSKKTLAPDILLVEDNPADVRLAMEALREGGIHSSVIHAADGEQAMRILNDIANGPEDGAGLPSLILLDLNLPRKDGREVLQELKADHRFQQIPVVVLTTSNAPEDIASCYSHAANSYVKKPMEYAQFVDIVQQIQDYWFNTSCLPPIQFAMKP